jgi:hypothetical protein
VYASLAVIHVSASDTLSGVSTTEWSLDGATWHAGSVVSVNTPGVHTLLFRAIDKAGNVETPPKTAKFVVGTYWVAPAAGAHGSISPAATETVNWGGSCSFTVTPAPGYHVAKVVVDGTSIGASSSVVFNTVKANHWLAASFATNTYSITPSAGLHGSVSPVAAQSVGYGASKTFTVTPATGYHVANVVVDGVSIGASSSVVFNNVKASHWLAATFAPWAPFSESSTARRLSAARSCAAYKGEQ